MIPVASSIGTIDLELLGIQGPTERIYDQAVGEFLPALSAGASVLVDGEPMPTERIVGIVVSGSDGLVEGQAWQGGQRLDDQWGNPLLSRVTGKAVQVLVSVELVIFYRQKAIELEAEIRRLEGRISQARRLLDERDDDGEVSG